MNLNDRPCWLQVNRCGWTNGLPGCQATCVGGHQVGDTHPGRDEVEWRGENTGTWSSLCILSPLVLLLYTHDTCVWGHQGAAEEGTSNEYVEERPQTWLCLLADMCNWYVQIYMYVEIIVTFVCKSTLCVLLSLNPPSISLNPPSIPLNPPLWMRKQPRISSSNY